MPQVDFATPTKPKQNPSTYLLPYYTGFHLLPASQETEVSKLSSATLFPSASQGLDTFLT